MNSITFTDKITFTAFVNALVLESVPPYTVDNDTLTISSNYISDIVDVAVHHNFDGFNAKFDNDEPFDGFNSDAEADADALASAGFGTDEDYGYYGDGGYDE